MISARLISRTGKIATFWRWGLFAKCLTHGRVRYCNRRCGFTLVEVLIVVVILGILATVVLPQFSTVDDEAKQSALMHDLQTLRSQITMYRLQHQGRFPGQGSTNPQAFRDALLLSSDVDGTTGTAGALPLGPYLSGSFPANPYTGGRGVIITVDVPGYVPDEKATEGGQVVGWICNPETGQIKANNTGTTREGVPLANL